MAVSRAVGAVVGCFIADAAGVREVTEPSDTSTTKCVHQARPIHWIYEVPKLDEVLKANPKPEFIKESHCPFNNITTGRNSCYGDQAFVLLESLVENKGFNKEDYKKKLYAFFGPDSEYEPPPKKEDPNAPKWATVHHPWRNGSLREFNKNFAEGKDKTGMDDPNDYKKKLYAFFGPDSEYEPKPQPKKEDLKELHEKKQLPGATVNHPWRNGSLREFNKNFAEEKEKTGMDDPNGDGYAKVAPLVALYAGKDNMASVIEEVIRVTQDNDLAVQSALVAAKVLEEYVLNGPSDNALDKVSGSLKPEDAEIIKKGVEKKEKSHREVIAEFGPGCSVPGSLSNVMHCLANSKGNFVDTVRFTMIGSGDNCARCCLVGSIMGAQVGKDGLPAEWISATTRGAKVIELAEKLAAMRS